MRHPHDKAESRFNTDTGISKEDEERYKKLVLENEELQKLIAQVRMTNDVYIHNIAEINLLSCSEQKEDKIRLLKLRLAERDQQKNEAHSGSQLQLSLQQTNGTMNSSNQLGLNQGKDGGIQIILPEPATTSDFDSAFGNGFSISVCTRSSDIEFSESYL